MPIAHSLLMAFRFHAAVFRRFPVHRRSALVGMPPVRAQPRWYRSPSMPLPGWSTCPQCTSTCTWQRLRGVGGVRPSMLGWRYARMVDASDAEDRVHARVVRIGVVMGMAALWDGCVRLRDRIRLLLRVTVIGSLWGCPAMTYLGVAHRMIPFFTALHCRF